MARENDPRIDELIAMIRERERERPDLIEVLIDLLKDDGEFELIRKSGKGGSGPRLQDPAQAYGSRMTEEQKRIVEERRERHLKGESRSYTWEEMEQFFDELRGRDNEDPH